MKRSTLPVLAIITITCLLVTSLIIPQTSAATGWTQTIQGEPNDTLTPRSIIQTSDGGYAIAVFAISRHVDNIGYPGHFETVYELQLIKTDSIGNVQWRQTFAKIDDPNRQTPTIYAGETYTIVQTADSGYAVAGYTYGANWLIKTDSQGRVLWTKTYEPTDMGSLGSKVTSMIKTNDAGFALAGSAETPNGGVDFWLIKTDSKGNSQWNQTYNSGTYKDGSGSEYPRDDVAQSLTQTRDGGYALVGSASLFRASTSSMVYAAWMVKTDANGKQNWNQGYDAINDQDGGYQIVQAADGGYAIAGTQNQDSCLLKADSTGKLQWTKTYADQYKGEFWNQAAGLAQLNDGGYAVAGTFSEVGTSFHTADLGLIRYDETGKQTWIKTYNAAVNTTTKARSTETTFAMIKTSDGAYAIAGTTDSATGTRQDVCLVKTETLEQPPQPTPTQNTQKTPTATTTPTQSTTPQTSTPTQTQPTQTPATSNNQSPSPENSQTPPTDTTNNPTETQTPNQQTTPIPSNTQPAPNTTGQQNESPTQEGTASITTIAAIAIVFVIAIAITAAIYVTKHKAKKT